FYRGDFPTATNKHGIWVFTVGIFLPPQLNYALIMAKRHRFALTKSAISSKTNYRSSRHNVSSTVHHADFSTKLPECPTHCGAGIKL
ncbi:hypothetical protein FSP93_RS26570, partial [Escherichia coli]